MDVFLNAVQGVLSILIMIVIGYVLSSKGWFDAKSSRLLSRLVVNIALPAYMISNIVTTYDRQKLIHLAGGLIIPFASMGICYGFSLALSHLLKIPERRRGTFCSMFALSNTIFVGLPVNLALFGEKSVPYVLLYYIANTSLFWTIGVYGIRRDGGGQGRLFSLEGIKRIFSPPLTGFLVAIVLVLAGIQLPKSVLDTCKYMGNLTTPLSMLFIGIVIQSVKLREIRVDRGMVAVMLGRFVAAPLLVFALCLATPLPLLLKQVFVIQSAMPVMTQTSIIAETYGADYQYAAVVTTVSTLLSLVMIPLYMVLIG